MATNLRPPEERRAHWNTVASASPVSQVRENALNLLRLAELESQEPACTCRPTDVDLFEASACEFHNPNSRWNVALRTLSAVERYEVYEPVDAQECPF